MPSPGFTPRRWSRTSPWPIVLSGLLLAATLAGCAVDVSFADTRYLCARDGVCPPGFSCLDGVCLPSEPADDDARPPGDAEPAPDAPPPPAGCGNGRLDEGEGCDDGNTADGDGCTSACVACTAAERVEHQGHCYELHAAPLAWEGARLACAAAGGHLVTYDSAAENAAVRDGLLLPDDVWIGLSAPAGAFVWVTGEALVYQNWDDMQPSGNGDCVEQDQSNGRWNDFGCDDGKPSICERER
jgi:cysteine-rich repeat protein